MKKRERLTEEQRNFIIVSYREHYTPMVALAERYGITREAVYKILHAAGVDTTKAQRIERTCPVCGGKVLRRRGMARKTKESYCNAECYAVYMETLGEDYRPSSYFARKSRETVKTLWPEYDPDKGHTVHHVNKDVTDFRPQNLEVYASQSDHLKHHRGVLGVQPLWRGKDLTL